MSHAANAPQAISGVGLGLRALHYQTIIDQRPAVPWFEALIDNYLGNGGLPLYYLEQIRRDYPMTFHGVGMSLGSSDPLDINYLGKLKQRIDRFQPQYVSDHLCWNSIAGRYGNDLFPMPYTEEALNQIADKIGQVQDFLGRRILVENVSSYVAFDSDNMTEWEFVVEVVKRADCDLLCDINNIYVSAVNHQFDPLTYLKAMPKDRIKEIHLAGYQDAGTHLLDTHGQPVHPPVWELYREAIELFGPVPTLIEWDTDIPPFDVLQAEADKARALIGSCYETA